MEAMLVIDLANTAQVALARMLDTGRVIGHDGSWTGSRIRPQNNGCLVIFAACCPLGRGGRGLYHCRSKRLFNSQNPSAGVHLVRLVRWRGFHGRDVDIKTMLLQLVGDSRPDLADCIA